MDNNTPHIKETGNQKQTQENVTKQKAKIDHSTEEDDKGRLNTSGDYNSDEVIKEFNKKLLSVHQLNQQHQSLIRNLSAKFGDISSSKKNNSPKSSKSPQSTNYS